MGSIGNAKVWAMMLCIMFSFSALCQATEQEKGENSPEQKGLQQRIDFSSSYILGQSIKSGAVYLMHRKKSDIQGMLEMREHYRNEILEEYDLENTALVPDSNEEQKNDTIKRD
jgi:hypothetical protein